MEINKLAIEKTNLFRRYIETENRYNGIDEMMSFYGDKGMIKQFRVGLPASGHLRLPIVNGMNYNVDYVLNKVARTGLNRLRISDTIFAGGKGTSLSDCLAAALGETFERIFGSFIFFEKFPEHIAGTYESLSKKHTLLNPEEYTLFLDKEYDDPSHMCERFTKESKIVWIKLNNNKKELWVPAQLIYLLYIGNKGEAQIGYSSSGGLSCHNTREEALNHGIYELVERDAINTCWNCKIPPKKIVFDEFPNSLRLKRLFSKYYYLLHDMHIYLHHTTENAFVITAIKKDSNIRKYYFLAGGGVSVDLDTAIEGAITEFIQAENNLKNLVFTPDWFAAHSIDYLFNVPDDVDFVDLKLFYQIIPYYSKDKNFKKLSWYLNDGEEIPY
ncbi:YcaO-like family protein, partial [Enterococcus faecium]